jgi:outer membrane lipoprotein-sorting protein
MIISKSAIMGIVLLGILAGQGASEELSGEMLERLQVIHQQTRTVSGSFVQEKNLAMFEHTLISRGSFAVCVPGKIHWAYEYPAVFGFASDGENVWRWNEESGASDSMPLSRDPVLSVIVEQMLAWSTMDTRTLERYFSITLVESRPISLLLQPKVSQLEEIIASVEIMFDSTDRHISKIIILEHDTDETVIRFENVSLNLKLSPELF